LAVPQPNFPLWLDEIFSQMRLSAESSFSAPRPGTQPELAASSHATDFEPNRAASLKIELLKAIGDLMKAAETCDRLKSELAALQSRNDATAISPPIAGRVDPRNRQMTTCAVANDQARRGGR
jgi:hypothetical protein